MNCRPRPHAGLFAALALLVATALTGAAAGQDAPAPHEGAVVPPLEQAQPEASFVGGATLKAYPYAYYSPETELAFGGGASVTWRHQELGPEQRPGSLLAAVTYTTRSQLMISLDPEFTTRDGKWLVDPYFGYKDYPDKFWGIGPETPAAAEEDFTPKIWDVQVSAQRSLGGGAWRAGPSYVLTSYTPEKLDADGQLGAGIVPGSAGGVSSGLGAMLSYDSRDQRFSAEDGTYAQLQVRLFGRALGSDYTFQQAVLDLRRYRTLKPGLVLALQAYTQTTSGEPPFNMLAMVGGSFRLRGYWTGRYRDRQAMVLQAEARVHLKGKLGAAAFAGAGTVGDTFSEFRFSALRPSVGAGLRWIFDQEANIKLRLDLGFGEAGQNGFYVTVMEAF